MKNCLEFEMSRYLRLHCIFNLTCSLVSDFMVALIANTVLSIVSLQKPFWFTLYVRPVGWIFAWILWLALGRFFVWTLLIVSFKPFWLFVWTLLVGFLAYLSWKLKCAFLIAFRPSSVCLSVCLSVWVYESYIVGMNTSSIMLCGDNWNCGDIPTWRSVCKWIVGMFSLHRQGYPQSVLSNVQIQFCLFQKLSVSQELLPPRP